MQSLHSPTQAAEWLRQHVTGALCTDSRQVRKGDAFIAWPGAATDGRAYVASAFSQGAQVCLVEAKDSESWAKAWTSPELNVAANVATYVGLKADTGWIADAYYEQPSQALQVLAVTGTNGKTSTTWWLAQALNRVGLVNSDFVSRCAVVGTLGVGEPPHLISTGLTTPDPIVLQAHLRKFVTEGVTHCAMEASSIGIEEQRLAGTRIHLAVFTNFTQDHLDYHGSMAAYWQAKASLFAWPDLKVAVVNVDDAHGAQLALELQTHVVNLWTCSSQGRPARLQAQNIQRSLAGMAFEVCEEGKVLPLQTSLMGDYNIDNLLGVMASLRALGISLSQAVDVCATLKAVPGRMEKVTLETPSEISALPLTLIDYAHTPDAVSQTLSALKPVVQSLGSQLWCVLGCGGDRDASKRPLMAAAAEALADKLVLTSDNPRSEMPGAIVADMRKGLKAPNAAYQELDRAKAIAHAVRHAGAHDVILIAGKGHENTQEIAGVKYPFDDRLQAQTALRERAIAAWTSGGQS